LLDWLLLSVHFRCFCVPIRIVSKQFCAGRQQPKHRHRNRWAFKVTDWAAGSTNAWQDWWELFMLAAELEAQREVILKIVCRLRIENSMS